jgi:hypothetical protein
VLRWLNHGHAQQESNTFTYSSIATIGDRVKLGRSEIVYEISRVSPEGDETSSLHLSAELKCA